MENNEKQLQWWNSLSVTQQKKWLSIFVDNLKVENVNQNKMYTSNSKYWNNGNIKLYNNILDNNTLDNKQNIDLNKRIRLDIELLKLKNSEIKNSEIKKSQSDSNFYPSIGCPEYPELLQSVSDDILYEVYNR
jgi:hypothetical protein